MAKADKKGQRKAPILRFKGFTDAWEQRKLKQLGNIKRGASPRPISDPKWFDKNGKYGWLRISDVTSQNGQVFQINQHLSSSGEEKTVLISDPHLIISIAATVGKPCINYIPTAIHDGFVVFLDCNFNLNFMFEWFNKNQNIWLKYGQPGAQINLNSSIIGNQKIKLPKKSEQEKIAKLFNTLNHLLALYERKIKLLLQVKKYFLDNLFAENQYPNLRFKGFTDAWEQRKLGNFLIPYKEKTIINNQYPVLTSSRNGIFLQKDYYKGRNIASKENMEYNVVPRNYFTYRNMTDDSKFQFNINTIVDKGIVSPLYPVFTTKKNLNSLFLKYQLNYGKKFKKFAIIQKQGGTRTSLPYSKLEKFNIIIPDYSEQNNITKFISKFDILIDSYNDKLKQIKLIKQELLNTMFI